MIANRKTLDCDAVVIGGGFYGCALASHLGRMPGIGVVLLEREPALFRRASYANQARVHNGYHYPRSLVTARRSRVNFPRFVEEYSDCIDDTFEKIYAIARIGSNVNGPQFERFCQLIGAPIEPAAAEIVDLFDQRLIERVYHVDEQAFDALKLRDRMARDLAATGVEVRLGAEATRVERLQGGGLRLFIGGDGESMLTAWRVYNCTYSSLNRLLTDSGLPRIALKQELTELCLIEVPEILHDLGVTVMCGPFFSCMPFPPRRLHSLSHVRYTPHFAWHEGEGLPDHGPDHASRGGRTTAFRYMLNDAMRFLPVLGEARYVTSLWETKTVLPKNEIDDGRPILLLEDWGLPGLSCVMGSKIDNVYDVFDCLQPITGA